MSIDIVFSLDQTGSMAPCTFEAKRKIKETSIRLFKDIPDLRIGFIAHGDYCDYRDYIIQTLNPTSDPFVLESFLRALYGVNGGDSPEAYEQVLRCAGYVIPWRAEAHKILVVVGDEVPHEVGYRNSWNALPVYDWHLETKHLAEMGVIVHGVQCLGNRHAKMFYQTIAKATGGSHLELNQLSNIVELIHAIAYQQSGQLYAYATELQGKGLFNRGLAAIFNQLQGKTYHDAIISTAAPGYGEGTPLDSVPPHRFQVLHVDERCVIQDFVNRSGARYKKGRGFYQFTKSETIQHHKEIVLRDKRTGDMFTGRKARELAGIPEGVTARVKPHALDQYYVFVQSTSYTRVLMPDTLFLYEVEEWA
jgi:hypothetical protein